MPSTVSLLMVESSIWKSMNVSSDASVMADRSRLLRSREMKGPLACPVPPRGDRLDKVNLTHLRNAKEGHCPFDAGNARHFQEGRTIRKGPVKRERVEREEARV